MTPQQRQQDEEEEPSRRTGLQPSPEPWRLLDRFGGPAVWHIGRMDSGEEYVSSTGTQIVAADGVQVASIDQMETDCETAGLDAVLMTAAPELYFALVEVTRRWGASGAIVESGSQADLAAYLAAEQLLAKISRACSRPDVHRGRGLGQAQGHAHGAVEPVDGADAQGGDEP